MTRDPIPAASHLPITQVRLGSDLVHVPRIRRLWQQFGSRFLDKIYTPNEQADCLRYTQPERVAQCLAGRWAAKEAAVKALGTGWRGVAYHEIEVMRIRSGAPLLQLSGQAKVIADTFAPITEWQVSISHDGEYALATAVFLCRAGVEVF